MNRQGISLIEILISTVVVGVLVMGMADFSAGLFDVSTKGNERIKNVSELRAVSEKISSEILSAAYIYPGSRNIHISGTDNKENQSFDLTISTNDSVAMLFADIVGTTVKHGLTAYFIHSCENNTSTCLYQFTSSATYVWTKNTCPALNATNFSGNFSKIVTDIDADSTDLEYILNYSNGVTDNILKGQIGSVTDTNAYALIKGISWEISQNNSENQVIQIKGLSKNVPRFIE
jgi:hypothetical protein